MTYEWHLFDKYHKYVETVYMTEDELAQYVFGKTNLKYYAKHEASECWQK